ncbi:alpha/beta hydrolase [Mycolicibacillus trivialis]|uniref:Esterase n=1 Tax=Mycolicibacillus trivialis TaxID=1798 RepID=A0A1X2EL41_9MYCO|nr:alpha/beta hydrolase fold domain-containing protein [Mycolicibacillus trivialis]ORX05568.1 esterase [Mycolicibacillus trivialis]
MTGFERSLARRVHRRRSPQSVAVELASRFVVKNIVRVWAAQPDLGWPFEAVDRCAGLLARRPAGIEAVRLEHCAAEWLRPANGSTRRAVLYLHGGAFLTCGLNTHRSLVSRLARSADAAVLNVAYRMLPRHPIGDAVGDALAGLRWLRRRGYRDEQIVVAGDSAGGYLAFMVALAAIGADLCHPAGIAAISPLTDIDPARKLAHRNARRCSMFPGRALAVFSHHLQETALSPVDADLSQLPPVTIHASGAELLLADADLMAQRLAASDVSCDLHVWDGQIHDFPLAADVLPEGRRALAHIGDFVQQVTAGSPGRNRVA